MRVGLINGHSIRDKGAENRIYGISEWTYNKQIIEKLIPLLQKDGIDVVTDEDEDAYLQEPKRMNGYNCDIIISLHANGFYSQTATGSEVIYWYSSQKGKRMAEVFQEEIHNVFKLGNRGIIPVDNNTIRGKYTLKATNCPCIIVEPFFITTHTNMLRANDIKVYYVDALRKSILRIGKEFGLL